MALPNIFYNITTAKIKLLWYVKVKWYDAAVCRSEAYQITLFVKIQLHRIE